MEDKKHCQICERDILANNAKGFIAHHGYNRPHQQGWQSASCFGARHLPVEVSNDAMQPYIDMVQRVLNGLNSRLYSWKHEPPMTITVKKGWGLKAHDEVLNRPEAFDPAKNEESYEAGRPWTYENEYRSHKHQLEAQKREADREIKRVSRLLAEWKPKQ